MGRTIVTPHTCACCGNELDDDDIDDEWCNGCLHHIGPEIAEGRRMHPWERMYFALHAVDCPYSPRRG
jgi:hypothetical protein